MIKQPTVFVLGAGASKPYGFPTGEELLADMQGLHYEVVQALQSLDYRQADWQAFQVALRKSSPSSIDSFLARRPDLGELGKLLIATSILRCEAAEKLYSNDDNWYRLLVECLDDSFDNLTSAMSP